MGWGEIFSLASALVWALAVILMKRAGNTLPAFELNLFKNCLALLLLVPTIALFHGYELPAYSMAEFAIVFVSGVIGIAVADTWYLRALNLMGASRTGIVSSLFSPFVILLSTVFLAERMVPWQWLGFFLVISGVLLVTWRVHHATVDSLHIKKGAIFGVGSMLMMALGVVLVKEVLETQPGLLAYMVAKGQWQNVKQNFRRPHPWATVVMASFLASYLSMILWLAGYKLIDASVASVLNETNVVFIVLLAWLMLGESVNARKIAGIGLTVGGVLIMVLV